MNQRLSCKRVHVALHKACAAQVCTGGRLKREGVRLRAYLTHHLHAQVGSTASSCMREARAREAAMNTSGTTSNVTPVFDAFISSNELDLRNSTSKRYKVRLKTPDLNAQGALEGNGSCSVRALQQANVCRFICPPDWRPTTDDKYIYAYVP